MRTSVVLMLLTVAPAFAQTAKAPALDAVDLQVVSGVQAVAKLADAACRALPEYKAYEANQKAAEAALTQKYPGFALDWTTRTLKPKAAPK